MASKSSTWDYWVYLFKRKVLRDYRAKLNYQYANGGWEWLGRLDEQAHHFVIAGYFVYLKKGGRVLDVGAGEGILNDAIQKANYSYYEGMDLSDEAARIGNERRGDDKTVFRQGNMDSYVPAASQKFDMIIINEALYFSKNARKCLNHLDQFLAEDGYFVVSMLYPKAEKIWLDLNQDFDFLDENAITNADQRTCTVRLLRRRKAS
jgi:2-polyprenyl-3-methyl-5-hydroxy-6-metoxy-1,4-benzoquinol methylase